MLQAETKAIDALLALINERQHIQLDISTNVYEYQVMREIVENLLRYLTVNVTLERRKHHTWVSENFTDDDNVACNNIGMGCNMTTWYGTPDARLRGYSTGDVDLWQYSGDVVSDGASSSKLAAKKLSQTIGTVVLASFTEWHLHQEQQLNPLVPCILMNCADVKAVMYDCVNDVLLITDRVDLRDHHDCVSAEAILFLWLFINHR